MRDEKALPGRDSLLLQVGSSVFGKFLTRFDLFSGPSSDPGDLAAPRRLDSDSLLSFTDDDAVAIERRGNRTDKHAVRRLGACNPSFDSTLNGPLPRLYLR